jgi:hypothetical protein
MSLNDVSGSCLWSMGLAMELGKGHRLRGGARLRERCHRQGDGVIAAGNPVRTI